jgi:phage FluMu protein Com
MAILRCKSCGFLREVPSNYAGKKIKCPSCQQVTQIHDTIQLTKKLFEMLSQSQKEVISLKQNSSQSRKNIFETQSQSQKEVVNLKQDSSQMEKKLFEMLSQSHKELVGLKQNASKTEKKLFEILEQSQKELVSLKQTSSQPESKLFEMLSQSQKELVSLKLTSFKREKKLFEMLDQSQKELIGLKQNSSQTEKKLFEMLDQSQKELVGLKQNSSQTEKKLFEMLDQSQKELVSLKQNSSQTEKKLFEMLSQLQAEIVSLKHNSSQPVTKSSPLPSTPTEPTISSTSPTLSQPTGYAFANLDSSPVFRNVEPARKWFQTKQVKTELDEKAMDISGFFDEMAVMLGDNYDSLKELLNQIKRMQANKNPGFTVDISTYNQNQIDIINKFCKEAYTNSFFSKFVNSKKNKNFLHITLQTEPKIVNFFNGLWLEWFVLMKVATMLAKRKITFSCLRGFKIILTNDELHEIDIFFLINGLPLWIECKTGEFRDSIAKYSSLRKRLNIDKQRSLLLVLDEPEEKLKTLTNMYDITFVNEKTWFHQVENLLPILSVVK